MSKVVKVLLAVVLLAVLLFAGIAAYITFGIDPNSFKNQIQQAAQERGMELDIQGDMAWSLFPSLALRMGKTRFSSTEHNVPESSFDSAALVLDWIPLLKKQVSIHALELNGADIQLTSPDQASALAAPAATADQQKAVSGTDISLAIDKVKIENSRLTLRDGESLTELNNIQLSSNGINTFAKPFSLNLSLTYRADNSEPIGVSVEGMAAIDQTGETISFDNTRIGLKNLVPSTVLLTATGRYDLGAEQVNLTNLVSEVDGQSISGSLSLSLNAPRTLTADFTGSSINLDTLLPQTEQDPAVEGAALFAPVIAPLALLDGGSGSVAFKLDRLTYNGLELEKLGLGMQVQGKRIDINTLSLGIFSGKIDGTASLDMSRALPRLTFNADLAAINIAEAQQYFGNEANLTGMLAMTMQGSSRGNNSEQLTANLNATGNMEIADPKLTSINIEQSYCEVAALVEKKPKREESWPAGTSLDNIVSHFQIRDGLVELVSYNTGVGNLKLRGDGTINLNEERFNIRVVSTLQGDRTSDNGCVVESERVRNQDLPLVCKDSFSSAGPGSCKPDSEFLKQALKNEVLDKIIEKSGDDEKAKAIEGLLKGLFN